jgi:hypothetical protein
MSAQISSPKATGGGGTAFEFAVQASFIATMLAQGRYPCLPDGDTEFIRLQAREAGYHTDDVFVQVLDKDGASHRLLVQIKSSCAFRESDTDFRETLTGAWDDFTNSELFDRGKDALLLATGPASAQAIKHFRPLLTWSRTSATSAEYFGKIATKDFASEQTRNYLATIRSLLTNHLAIDPEDADLWVFLRHLHWSEYDFDTDDSQDLSRVIGMLGLALDADSPKGADTVWSECVTLVSEQNPVAGTLTRQHVLDRFPRCFRHGAVTVSPGIARLAEHSAAILGIVETTLRNGYHVDRSWLIRLLWDWLVDKQQLLIAGAAGSGKSAIIKEMLTAYGAGIPTFVLKADELDRPHIHEALVGIGVTESIETLSQRFGLLRPKLLIVEALEKLLEADTLDAFQQLLSFVSRDDTWMIVLSCRSHALGDIKNEILFPQRMSPPVIEIPLLRDWELEAVLTSTPELGRLAQNESIMRLLRVPMYLSYATGVYWGEQAQRDTVDDTAFRSQLWRSVIRRDARHSGGMNRRRERCFVDVAVTRAKAMRPFIDPMPFEPDVVHALEVDGLITATDEGIAPAHDLFEDWAIERHVEVLFREQGASPQEFFSVLGAEPAIRRGFRAWLTGRLSHDDGRELPDFIADASNDCKLPASWRDEVLVATLLSPHAGLFFSAQDAWLLSDEMRPLVRIIHLLRTACKEPDTSKLSKLPLSAKGRDLFASMFLTPAGPGWQSAITFLGQHLENVGLRISPTVLGLLQDWVAGLDPAEPLPNEARSVGVTALHLMDLTREDHADDTRKDILRVAFRVSEAIRDELHDLFEETLSVPVVSEDVGYGSPFVVRQSRPDAYRFYEGITDAAVETFHCSHLCASIPEDVAALARRKWLPTRKPGEYYRRRSSVDIGEYFGIDDDFGFKMHPASAMQGPFYFLLKGSTDHGLQLVLDLINTTSELYAWSDLDSPAGQELPKVTVMLNDGREIKQYLSWRLWAGYRGNTVLPETLQSSLMALEKWILELAKSDQDMGEIFDRLLEDSCSCAISGVLASLATNSPGRIREHMFPLLRTREFFELDMARALQEAAVIVDAAGMMGMPERAENQIHVDERKQAKESDHRKHYLETLVLNLQFSDLREPVQQIIDTHLSSLPPLDEQTDNDRTWRLALHRMDLRKCRFEPAEGDKVPVTSTDPDQDIQEMQTRSLPEIQHRQKLAHANLWSRHEFLKPGEAPMPFEGWPEAVQWARDTVNELDSEADEENKQRWLSGPYHIAALSIRDHLDELDLDDLAWCALRVVERVVQSVPDAPRSGLFRNGKSDGTAASASVLPLLLGGGLAAPSDEEIRLAIAGSLTHPDPDVRNVAVRCSRQQLWSAYPKLARSCLAGMIRFGQLEKQESEESRQAHADILDPTYKEKEAAVEEKYRGLRSKLRSAMAAGEMAEGIGVPAISLDEWSVFHLASVVHMFPEDKALFDWEPLLLAIMNAMLTAEEEDENRKRNRGTRLFALKRVIADCAAYFSMKNDIETAKRLCVPFCDRMHTCPDYVADFVEQLIINAEHAADPGHFWQVWHLFADPAFDSQRLKSKHMRFREEKLLRSLLLGTIPWKSDVHEWSVLSGAPSHMAAACAKACQTSAGFEATMGLLYSVGTFYLPNAFRWLADALPALDRGKVFSDKGNRLLLESLLQREVHMHSTDIRRQPQLQASVLALLDVLVDFGSSSAFHLREKIVRPPRPT